MYVIVALYGGCGTSIELTSLAEMVRVLQDISIYLRTWIVTFKNLQSMLGSLKFKVHYND